MLNGYFPGCVKLLKYTLCLIIFVSESSGKHQFCQAYQQYLHAELMVLILY